MKTIIFLSALLSSLPLLAQFPNASFENWEQQSTWEVPANWHTNNTEMGFVSVTKVESLTDGDYAMKVVNKGISFEGYDSGQANCTFLPSGSFNQLGLSCLIDSISGGASIDILISQYDGNQYEQIGSWHTEVTTSGIKDLAIPLSPINIDSLRIDIRSNSVLTATGQVGYAEIIVDNLSLSFTSSTVSEKGYDLFRIYPIPSTGWLTLSDLALGKRYKLHDTGGNLIEAGTLSSRSFYVKKDGLLILSIEIDDEWIHRKIMVKR